MKTLISAVILFGLALANSHTLSAANKKNDPSQFAIVVHVSAATYVPQYDSHFARFNAESEIITATINGRHYQLEGPTSDPRTRSCCNGLLDPGDYHARLSKDEHKTSFESNQEYEFLFPDGSTRHFHVVAQSE